MIPLDFPVGIVCILFLVFWIAPIISKRIKIPTIILYILFGIVVGPFGFGLIGNDDRIKLLSDIGIMFIMFLAGLELNASQIKSNKETSVFYGILIIIVPISVGFTVFHFFLGYEVLNSVLISLMFSTQTLVSYPIASRLGLTSRRSVVTAVGGTIISDSVVLFSIGLVVASSKGGLDPVYFVKFLAGIAGFALVLVFIFPFFVRRFFNNDADSGYSSFSLVIFCLFLAGTLAEFIGLESIIGAFMAGIVLNKYIPKNSSLLSNLHFVGNGIFIPMFLFYVGMLIDYQAVVGDIETLIISGILIVIALGAKLFSSFVAGKIFKFRTSEIGLLFGLTSAHAAVVIATALIGFNIGLISVHILNATILLILVSCISSTFVTEHFGKRVILESPQVDIDDENNIDRVIVPYANPNTVDGLLNIAVNMTYPTSSVIYPLTIVTENNKQYKETISINRKKITEIMESKYSRDIRFSPVSRIDINPTTGINRALKELMGTMLIIGWTGNIHRGGILGRNITNILEHNDIQTVVYHINSPLNYFKNIVVTVPDNANLEKGFSKWMHHLHNLSNNSGLSVNFICSDLMIDNIRKYCNQHLKEFKPTYTQQNSQELKLDYIRRLENTSLLIILFARDKSISFSSQSENIIKALQSKESILDFMVIMPEQYSIGDKIDVNNF